MVTSKMGSLLEFQGVSPASVHKVKTARILAAALVDPDCRLELRAIAERTGIPAAEIVEIMNSVDWQEALRGQLLSLAGAGMIAIVDRLRRIALDDNQRTADQIAAAKALHNVWKDSAQIVAASQAIEDEETAKAFLKSVKPMKSRLLEDLEDRERGD